ncbi:MAG: metallophosphoesterase [Aromatoleum sp.]|uniref:metallophosphoesterase family protein n=1 Tax=Aromatoleum sp. TaxID=2307007 RepID=UPI002895A5C5|nr:metallophosphoesterase [Aromatoleum sp.]MDT3668698.1 metallophosphoesterase [Aromatoleum sp.]
MIRLAHISDPHFGTEDPPVCTALTRDLLREAPDLVVLTGDITQRARTGEFLAARTFLNGLAPLPVLALPGNHDLPLFDLFVRFRAPYGRFLRYIAPSLCPTWQKGSLAILGINSTRLLRHKHGNLPRELIDEVARELERIPQCFKVVALHHPLTALGGTDRKNRVRHAEEAIGRWSEAGADLFLGGHIHLPSCVAGGHPRKQTVFVQAGTSVSTRRRGRCPNSYNIIRFETDGTRRMHIQQRDHDNESGRFVGSISKDAVYGSSGWTILTHDHPEHGAEPRVEQ